MSASAKRNPIRTKTYNVWVDMNNRCYNVRNKAYGNYGARGITVCDRWRHDYNMFFSDMGAVPDGLTLERRNNDLGYLPSNCLWVSRADQNKNRRYCRPIEYLGRTQNLSDWAREFNINKSSLRHRLDIQKLGMADAVNKDLFRRKHVS